MEKITVLGVLLTNRTNTSPKFQEVITKHGCKIKTRIGLHSVTQNKCSTNGVILLEVIGDEAETAALESDIKAIPGTQIQKICFDVD